MKRLVLSLSSVAALCIATPAIAQMPYYDPEAHCHEVASAAGGASYMILNECLREEQQAYDQLKSAWPGVPGEIRHHCDEVAGFGGGSYMILQECVREELGAADSSSRFQFRR